MEDGSVESGRAAFANVVAAQLGAGNRTVVPRTSAPRRDQCESSALRGGVCGAPRLCLSPLGASGGVPMHEPCSAAQVNELTVGPLPWHRRVGAVEPGMKPDGHVPVAVLPALVAGKEIPSAKVCAEHTISVTYAPGHERGIRARAYAGHCQLRMMRLQRQRCVNAYGCSRGGCRRSCWCKHSRSNPGTPPWSCHIFATCRPNCAAQTRRSAGIATRCVSAHRKGQTSLAPRCHKNTKSRTREDTTPMSRRT